MAQTTHLWTPVEDWDWRNIRDYLTFRHQQLFGEPMARKAKAESAVLRGFLNRWGQSDAVAISKRAMEHHRGIWIEERITIDRFSKGNDPFFAEPLLKEIERGSRS